MNITNFTIFRLWGEIARDWEDNESLNGCFNNLTKLLWLLNLAPFSLKVNYEIFNIKETDFNFESTYDLTDVPASIYGRKTAARRFDTTYTILRSFRLAQFLLKGRNASIWRQRELTHMRLSGIESLITFWLIIMGLNEGRHSKYPSVDGRKRRCKTALCSCNSSSARSISVLRSDWPSVPPIKCLSRKWLVIPRLI